MNCHGTGIAANKISCIPIGVKQWDTSKEDLQRAYLNGYGLVSGIFMKEREESELLSKYVLSSFRIKTNVAERSKVHELFCSLESSHPIARIANCDFLEDLTPYEFYTSVLAKSRFVVSPHGAGLDCYRTYEALFMGAIPIVKTSTLDSMFKDLPVLIVEDWVQLTVTLLEETERVFLSRRWDFRKLYTDYWYHKVRSHF
ncbi:hypothetical protein HDU82_004822 [Entophlyctis luteolus]|nr:hypothetical protein HDU82_004822 [Entophlyctis luteolus]